MFAVRKTLAGFTLVAVILCGAAQSVSAGDTRADKSLAALTKKIKEVELVPEMSKVRAWMSGTVEKVSVAHREGNFCEALKGLFEFSYYVSRFELIRQLTKDGKDHGELLSLAQKASHRIARRADKLGVKCPGPR